MFDQIHDASKIVLEKLSSWLHSAISMLPNFVIAILVIVLFIIISKIISSLMNKTLPRVVRNSSVLNLLTNVTSIAIILIGLFVALGVMNLDKTVTSLLAGVGLLGLAVGFAFQDAIANFISGIFMAVKSPINIGDVIKYEDHYGVISHIGLRATTVEIPEGYEVVIPNRLIFQNPYNHYTIHKERRVDLHCGISYGEDLQKVEDLVTKAIRTISYLKDDRIVEFYYEEFCDSSINFVVRYWIAFEKPSEYFKARHDGIKLIKKTFNENDITIPFPIRTLDFGIKGGEKLSAMLKEKKEKT